MGTKIISRKTHAATFKKCKTLGQLITAVEKEGEANNLYITKLSLNGRLMDQDEESLLDSMSVNQVDTLEVDFAGINQLIKSSFADIISAIQNVQLQAIEFAKTFRKDSSVDDEKVKYILIQCRSIIEGLEEIFKAHSHNKITIKHISLWFEAEKELTNILQGVLQARRLSGSDFIADLIEYDLVQALDQWEEVVEKELVDNPAFTGIFNLKTGRNGSDNGVDA